jgi:hypothetical protein
VILAGSFPGGRRLRDRLDHGSRQTPRWSKADSNHRSPSRGFAVIFGEEKGPQAISVVSKDFAFLGGDRWFESASLQRRVRCEPEFRLPSR